jgi:hypothetical protein
MHRTLLSRRGLEDLSLRDTVDEIGLIPIALVGVFNILTLDWLGASYLVSS